jgi:hypothetical protein
VGSASATGLCSAGQSRQWAGGALRVERKGRALLADIPEIFGLDAGASRISGCATSRSLPVKRLAFRDLGDRFRGLFNQARDAV